MHTGDTLPADHASPLTAIHGLAELATDPTCALNILLSACYRRGGAAGGAGNARRAAGRWRLPAGCAATERHPLQWLQAWLPPALLSPRLDALPDGLDGQRQRGRRQGPPRGCIVQMVLGHDAAGQGRGGEEGGRRCGASSCAVGQAAARTLHAHCGVVPNTEAGVHTPSHSPKVHHVLHRLGQGVLLLHLQSRVMRQRLLRSVDSSPGAPQSASERQCMRGGSTGARDTTPSPAGRQRAAWRAASLACPAPLPHAL